MAISTTADAWPASLLMLHPRGNATHVSNSRTVLVTDAAGVIDGAPEQGLWAYQTRLLKRYRWLVNGKPPQAAGCSHLEQHTWMGYAIAHSPALKKTGNPAQQAIEVRLERVVGEGFHEEVELTNHTQRPVTFTLALQVEPDFADAKEARGKRKQHGKLQRRWRKLSENLWELEWQYHATHRFRHQGDAGTARLERGVRLHIGPAQSKPTYENDRVTFRVRLSPHERWHGSLQWSVAMGGQWLAAEYAGAQEMRSAATAVRAQDEQFVGERTGIRSRHDEEFTTSVLRTIERASADLLALRLHDLDSRDGAWTVAAGVPTYMAFFGRDSLRTGLAAALLSPKLLTGALRELAHTQAKKVDDWRDEQPGRMVHEIHTNPLSVLNFDPHGRYYGGVTASLYFPHAVAELWRWTGDEELVRPLVKPALKCLAWARRYGDFDGDGFCEYTTRSKQGEKNQAWKDSDDAIVDERGRQVPDPIGTCEMQADLYSSKARFAEVLAALGEQKLAKRLACEAEDLKQRFNETFWMEDEGYIALAKGPRNRLVRSVASDPGHCLALGAVADEHVEAVARRLMSAELFSGWGVRTLSALHPAFNPFSYHRGSVWPMEAAIAAHAFSLHGFTAELHRLARSQFEAASMFLHCRLPEVFAGHARDAEHPFPGLYPRADWPQAWSSAAVIDLVRSLLGLHPFAHAGVLLVDPQLPEWLPELEVGRLQVGKARVSLRFERQADGSTGFRVMECEGALKVVRRAKLAKLVSGWPATEDVRELAA